MSHRGGVFGRDEKLPPAVKYGLTMLFVQAEFGLCCPLSMTDSLTRTLCKFGSQELIDRFFPMLTTQTFEDLYQGAMFITEQDAGSDVGAVTTEARFENGQWRLYGDKWFCSNPDADLAMVLARPQGGLSGTKGLSLFLLPRRLKAGCSIPTASFASSRSSVRARWQAEKSCLRARLLISSARPRPASSR